jgi:hypothetical protein
VSSFAVNACSADVLSFELTLVRGTVPFEVVFAEDITEGSISGSFGRLAQNPTRTSPPCNSREGGARACPTARVYGELSGLVRVCYAARDNDGRDVYRVDVLQVDRAGSAVVQWFDQDGKGGGGGPAETFDVSACTTGEVLSFYIYPEPGTRPERVVFTDTTAAEYGSGRLVNFAAAPPTCDEIAQVAGRSRTRDSQLPRCLSARVEGDPSGNVEVCHVRDEVYRAGERAIYRVRVAHLDGGGDFSVNLTSEDDDSTRTDAWWNHVSVEGCTDDVWSFEVSTEPAVEFDGVTFDAANAANATERVEYARGRLSEDAADAPTCS